MSAQLPWGNVTLGKRPAEFGMGLSYDGSDNRSLESLSFTGMFGPLQLEGPHMLLVEVMPRRLWHRTRCGSNERDEDDTRAFDFIFPLVKYHAGNICELDFSVAGSSSILVVRVLL